MPEREGLIYVKPAAGRTVRDYRTRLPVPAEGMFVPVGDPHWMASLNFHDLVEAEPPEEPKPEPEPEPEAEPEPAPEAEPVPDAPDPATPATPA